ncbi:MAG TPA: glutamate synthase large subunit [Polyangiaceae bacterium]|jgi:glutamate synthase (NADPH/NADH) large chain
MPLPSVRGLYDPSLERDACGLGFVADLRRAPTHEVVCMGIEILRRLAHRGAAGCDPCSSDGAGILIHIPHVRYERTMAHAGIEIPLEGDYGVAQCFFSRDPEKCAAEMRTLESAVRHHNQKVIGWRDVPVDPAVLGPIARASMPVFKQLFVGRMCPAAVFERTLFMIRKRAGRRASEAGLTGFYMPSLSSKTVIYKGLSLPERLADFYLDLREEETRSRLALVHSRFSTNTFPTWERAHPYRRIAHNGEINTLRGNQTWMHAREPLLASAAFGEHLADFKPIIRPGGSDSASLDNVVDFLVAGGRSLPHVMMMLVPEAWEGHDDMPAERRAFYEYHSSLVEPWDGPAALLFTDGHYVGATLDRNGLRPMKYVVTSTGFVVAASELGVLDFEPEEVLEKGRLQPGKMFLVDLTKGRLVGDEEIKREVAAQKPYAQWLEDNKLELTTLPAPVPAPPMEAAERRRRLRAAGYSREDLRILLTPMATAGEEPTGSMGNDAPLAVLSERPQLLFRYFKQQFAQVTNPPIDPIREKLVMTLASSLGGEGNLLDESPSQCRLLELEQPVLTSEDLARLTSGALADFPVRVLPMLFDAREGERDERGEEGTRQAARHDQSLERALAGLCEAAERAVDEGTSVLVLSDRGVDREHAAIPSLLAMSAVHHALARTGKRMRVGLVVETGEAREVADVALLIGYGAGAVCPYLAMEAVDALDVDTPRGERQSHYVHALDKGLMKVMSKMGISCLSSYQGAQIFEAVGIGRETIDRWFPGTHSRIGGIGLAEIARETLLRHGAGYQADVEAGTDEDALEVGGVYAWRVGGERHLWSPKTVASLQKAVRTEDARSYEEYARAINEQGDAPFTLRGCWDLAPAREPVPLEEVEPAVKIVRRFATGAMSFGSISREAHENLAVAMNRIGGKSNSGEGGEDPARFLTMANGDSKRSAIKQVASARFGVTAHYLVNADELQIKIAQGAKPGEGGQLPGHKVDEAIARVRHSVPGVTLISPPPHHDIYSIEDLAQLIFDLKCVNPEARISVKLVSETGVGTIAAGVAKAHAAAIHIAGHDGGTGASPLSSIHHAGTSWELGLAETHQVLVLNGLRKRVRLQVDGQLKTGRDVAFAALLGADEFGFATAPLVASGCVMMRKCHLNTCPVGVATQDPVLRARFAGTPEHVINYFFFVAEELRGIMARLGFRTLDAMVGHTDRISIRPTSHPKARTLDFTDVLLGAEPLSHREEGRGVAEALEASFLSDSAALRPSSTDEALLEGARLSVKYGAPSTMQIALTNADRAFGARLAGDIARKHGANGLNDGAIVVECTGTAGQSFGAFATRGMLLVLEGDANDYVGKGLSGGVLAIRPPARASFKGHENVLVGNTCLYGATSGKAFFAGKAGERFAVRNSGALAVVEGVGDHGCEYMTGGTVVVLGPTGRNFAAGMSGGIAYVLDDDRALMGRVSKATVDLELLGARDEEALLGLVEEHVAHTRSARGKGILASWGKRHFVKVMPHEWRRILQLRETG